MAALKENEDRTIPEEYKDLEFEINDVYKDMDSEPLPFEEWKGPP